VGFGSPSYFIKSFHDYFGYSPGEFVKYAPEEFEKKTTAVVHENTFSSKQTVIRTGKFLKLVYSLLVFISAVVIIYLIVQNRNFKITQNSGEKSIIVLPLLNFSSDENTQYFADGLSNEILSQLAKIPGLKVKTGMSAEQFRKSTLSAPEIARLVNANYILDGSVQQFDNNVHISVELSDARQDRILWSEKYDRENAGIFAIYIDIAKKVADNLQSILSTEEIEQIEKSYPINFEAYNNYLMGQYFCLKRDSISIQKGVKYFEKAIEIDPAYTLAYSGLSNAYYALSFTGNIERSMGYDKAYNMAEKALEMDSTLSEARKLFEKALEVDSNCMVAHLYYCSFLDIVGEPDNALKHANMAIELEPYFHMPYHMKGIIYRNEKKIVESTEAFRISIELNPESWSSYYYNFFNFLYLNEEALAVESLYDLFSINPDYQKHKNEFATIYKNLGINGVLNLFLNARLEHGKQGNPFLIATLNNMLGKQNEALTSLEGACRERESDIPRMISIPEFENLHSHPRFHALVDTMNLRPYFPNLPE
jgi:TolB-like protein/Tfp pilus assembly protein PilF